MTRIFRQAALHLALAAMMLRALLPVGWMPNPAGLGQSSFVICTADGWGWRTDHREHGQSTPNDGRHSHEECPFAAAPHFAPPAAFAQVGLPSVFWWYSNSVNFSVVAPYCSACQPRSPRAPPHFA